MLSKDKAICSESKENMKQCEMSRIRHTRSIHSLLGMSVLMAVFSSVAFAQGNSNGGSNGQPFQDLQDQLDELRAIVNNEPIEIAVDCPSDSVNSALASVSNLSNPVVINISGICSESAFIDRDEVTLRGTDPQNDGIFSQFSIAAWVTGGASQIRIENLSLSGGFASMACLNGASAIGTGLDIVGNNSGSGVLAFYGGNCEVVGSIISNHNSGVNVGANTDIVLRGTTIENSNTGATVRASGTLSLERLAFTIPSNPSIVRNNHRGINVMSNGSIRAVQVDIIDNTEVGIYVHSGGSLLTESSSNSSIDIMRNDSHGIVIDKLTNAFFAGVVNTENNGGSGIQCFGTVSVFDQTPSVYFGSPTGYVNCPVIATSN